MLYKEALDKEGKSTPYYSSSPLFRSNLINGISNLSEITITAFERLTQRSDIRYTTLFMWKEIFSSQQLMRAKRTWCSTCYEEQAAQGGIVYEPLTWSIEAISICPRHHIQLCQTCPHCGGQSDFLGTNYRPGYCSGCLKWLGAISKATIAQRSIKSLETLVLSHQLAALNCVGKLLSHAPNIISPLKQQDFIKNLAGIIEIQAGGNINSFAELAGVWSGNVRRLLSRESKLRMEGLCQLCIGAGISPIELLSDKKIEKILPEDCSPLSETDSSAKSPSIPWLEVENEIQTATQECPPPSLEAVAHRIGYYPARLKAHFPRQCERITCRYKKHLKGRHPSPSVIRKTFNAALKESPPPSLQNVLRRLRCRDTGWYYYNYYSDLCFAVSRRYKKSRSKPFNKEVILKKLEAALIEDPPPSLSSIAIRLGRRRQFFSLKYPELTKMIASRHMNHRRNLQSEAAETLRHLIREGLIHIAASGQYASEARVKEYLRPRLPSIGRDYLFKRALREVKAEIGLDV
jgi:hypothetical protein